MMCDYLRFASAVVRYQDAAKSDAINNYWKLDTIDPDVAVGQLIALDRGCFRHSLTPKRAQDLNKRRQRQMLLYERCSTEELEKFCADRSITLCGTGSTEPRIIVKALEHADHFATFPNFCRLPAELREEIYHHYLNSLNIDAIFPTEPPLLRASRQLRHESLPLFYRGRVFTISLPVQSTDGTLDLATLQTRAAKYQRLLGSNGSADVLGRVQQLRVRGEVEHRGETGWFTFDLGEGCEDGVVVYVPRVHSQRKSDKVVFWEQLLTARMKCLRARFDRRGKGLQLRAGDWEEFLQLFGGTRGEVDGMGDEGVAGG